MIDLGRETDDNNEICLGVHSVLCINWHYFHLRWRIASTLVRVESWSRLPGEALCLSIARRTFEERQKDHWLAVGIQWAQRLTNQCHSGYNERLPATVATVILIESTSLGKFSKFCTSCTCRGPRTSPASTNVSHNRGFCIDERDFTRDCQGCYVKRTRKKYVLQQIYAGFSDGVFFKRSSNSFEGIKVSRDTFHFPWTRKFSFFSL